MTDRFYQIGLEAERDVYQTSYEVANAMHTGPRSPFPPGYSGHQPGARQKFGYSTPGPDTWRLSHPELYGDAPSPSRRGVLALTRTPVHDDSDTFWKFDVDAANKSRVGRATFTNPGKQGLNKSRSVPAMPPPASIPRLSEIESPVTRLEDNEYSYFVPKSLQRERREKMPIHIMSKIKKDNKVTLPYTGEGTGFRTQMPECNWQHAFNDGTMRSTYMTHYQKPPFYRSSPLRMAGTLQAVR